MCGKEEENFFNLNNFRDQFDSDEEDKLRSVLGDALLRYNIKVYNLLRYNLVYFKGLHKWY